MPSDEEKSSNVSDDEEDIYRKGISMKSVREYDKIVNSDLTNMEKNKFYIFTIILVLLGFPIIYLAVHTMPDENFCKNEDEDDEPLVCFNEWQILFNILSLAILFISAGIITGIISIKSGINVGYTRKTLHFCSFFLPFGINKLFPTQGNIFVTLIKFWCVLIVYLLASKMIRRKFWISAIIFRSIDRPEDRPYTLSWMVSQFVASSIVLGLFSYLWIYFEDMKDGDNNFEDLSLIVVLINGLGDGLAEPVGIKFGKHKYKTRALYYDGKFWNGEFTRSYEGSSVVFLVSMMSLGIFYYIFTIWQLVIAFIFIPIIMTLTEAYSPRTWDNPFLSLVGSLLLLSIINFPV